MASQPICSRRLPILLNAADTLLDVVLLPMPPLPQIANTGVVPIFRFGSSSIWTLPSPSVRVVRQPGRLMPGTASSS